MIFRNPFPGVLRFTLNARKGPLIPEGFVLETLSESKPTPPQSEPEHRQFPPQFHSIPPTTSRPAASLFACSVSETPSGSVIMIGNDSTETLVNITIQPVHLKPILKLNPSAHEVRQTRRISFVDPTIARTPTNVASVGHVLCESPMTTQELPGRAEEPRECIPEVGKISRRKSVIRAMSLLKPRTRLSASATPSLMGANK